MSDPGKEENNDNPSKISEILADFFLKKIDMPYASDDSDRLHKSKRKKSKHKKRKHKKYKHRHRSSSSDSRTELNIKGVDDISSSEEMGIKRLKKIKSIKMQSVNNLVLQSASSVSSHSGIESVKPNDSSNKKPVFYGPSLELLLTGVNNNLDVDSNPNLFSSKDLSSDDKKMPESEITDLKEIKNSFPENFNEGCIKDSENTRPPNVSLDCSGVNSSTKDNCDNDSEIISTHLPTTNFNDLKDIRDNNFKSSIKENDFQPVFKEKNSETMSLNDCKIALKKDEPEMNTMNDDLKTEKKNEECRSSMNENHSKTSVEEKDYVSEVKEQKSDNTKETNVDCINTKLDHSKSLPRNSETLKKESKEECIKNNSVNSEKPKSDSNHKNDTNKQVTKPKKKDSKRKHSKSRSRSASPTNHTSSRSKHKNHKSRSSSRDSYHAKRKKRQRSRSRSYSHGKTRSRDYRRKSYSRSYSRSRSRSRHKRIHRKSHSRSPHKRSSHRHSRSRSYNRSKESSRRTQKRSKSREHHHSSSKYHDRSRSRKRASHSKSKSRSKSRHKSISPKKSRSRSKSKDKKSSSEKNNKIDQAKILETARRNVLQMIKKGTLPEGLPIENLKKEQLLTIQAGGKSVQELTDFCQRLSQKENEPDASDNEDKADDETGFIHHPFKVKEPGVIKLNIKNAIQLPIRTHAQKVAETARLSSQFPVSSGNKHRQKQKELEWIPVVPESSKTETKSTVSAVSTIAESSTAIIHAVPVESSVLPVPTPPPVPIAYPCPPPPETLPVATVSPVLSALPATVPLPSVPPPPLPPAIQSTTVYQTQPIVPSYVVPSQQVMFSTVSVVAQTSSTSVFKPAKKLDISSIITKRYHAIQKLNENPNDVDALRVLQEVQESVQDWLESQQVPGQFTGSTDVKLLTVNELSGPFKYRNRKTRVLFIT